MCTQCNACLNGLVSYCEMFICDGEACKFWTVKGPTQRVIQRWFWWCLLSITVLCVPACTLPDTQLAHFWPWSLARAIVGSLIYVGSGAIPCPSHRCRHQFHWGIAPLSLSLQIIFFSFFLSCSAFLPTLPSLLSYPPPSIPIFISPFWPWRLQSLGVLPLTQEF